MRPIGGYFELERGPYAPLHHSPCSPRSTRLNSFLTNSGRSALRLIVRLLKITRIHVPNYTCPVVHAALNAEGCTIVPYNLDTRLMPACTFPKDDFILANDYFGLTGGNIAQLAADYPNLIVDNAQSYFAAPLGRAAFYSPRKFMGLPDGGIAVFNKDDISTQPSTLSPQPSTYNLQPSTSYSRMASLLKRHDLGPSAGYADFKTVSHELSEAPVLAMSNLTQALISTINPDTIRSRRLANFATLHAALKDTNELSSILPLQLPTPATPAPLIYPYVTHDPSLRQRLIDAQIFVATYWPGCEHSDSLVNTILPIPIDQRYDESDMERILSIINKEQSC